YQEKMQLAKTIVDNTGEAIVITDTKGIIRDVNPAFSAVTGYERHEVVGKNPKLLKSGMQEPGFYQQMWQQIAATGFWQGEIWNRRKSGEVYR
ncbi:PAS domain S-box protein, partial [Mesorhizobium sp. M00.F.Ca.ET.186.01.1.1]